MSIQTAITRNTTMSQLKKMLDQFFRTKGKHIIPGEFYAGRNNEMFNRISTLNQNKANIMLPDSQGRRNYFNVYLKLEPLSDSNSQFSGKQKRRTMKKRKSCRKRRTDKRRKSYRRK